MSQNYSKFISSVFYFLMIVVMSSTTHAESIPTEEYIIQFVARPSAGIGFGHTYINFISPKSEANKCFIGHPGYGFYPSHSNFFNLMYGAGAIRNEQVQPSIEPKTVLNAQVSADEFHAAAMVYVKYLVRTWSSYARYSLGGNNCVSFVDEVAEAAGFIQPSSKAVTPERYLANLYQLNSSRRKIVVSTKDNEHHGFLTSDPLQILEEINQQKVEQFFRGRPEGAAFECEK
jgi:hypothetical protein